MYAEKFIEPFIGLIEKHFEIDDHLFLIKPFKSYEVSPRPNITYFSAHISVVKELLNYTLRLNQAEKIIIHGLFNPRLVLALFLQPWLLKKCYWIMWGGDLYFHDKRGQSLLANIYEKIRGVVIKRIGHLVSQMHGDIELARSWYKAKGQHHDCFVYLSNVFKAPETRKTKHASINILAGNSSNPSNNHEVIFKALAPFKDMNIRVYCPLSYGSEINAKLVAENGLNIFGEKFIPLFEMLPLNKYLDLLDDIDIAIFANDRQQASGNMVTLLGLGKKVFLSRKITPWQLFEKLKLKVFDVEDFNLEPISNGESTYNSKIISSYFSEENLIRQLKEIFR